MLVSVSFLGLFCGLLLGFKIFLRNLMIVASLWNSTCQIVAHIASLKVGVVHAASMRHLFPLLHLVLNINLKLFNIIGSYYFEKHLSAFLFKLSVSAFLRFLDVREALKVLEVFDIVLEQQVAFFGQFFWVDLFLLGKKLVGVINQSCWGIY